VSSFAQISRKIWKVRIYILLRPYIKRDRCTIAGQRFVNQVVVVVVVVVVIAPIPVAA
jgi:hypothetical protein